MVIELLAWICTTLLLAVSAVAVYQWVLAAAALSPAHGRRRTAGGGQRSRLLVLIPAYNEEAGLAATLSSLERVDYPRQLMRVVVIADRCEDATAGVARNHGVECLERSSGRPGKGAAIAWAMSELRRAGVEFEGLVLVDADTIVDPGALAGFDEGLRSGHDVQQGYNYLSNPWESPFTRIIAVTSVLRNALFYGGKERLGLSSMLSGCGMCFSDRVLARNAWAAFSVGEDWEFSVALLLNDERIHFNGAARVRAAESRGLRQASTQRLRWASGRHGVAASSTMKLLAEGVRQRRIELWDAALTLIAPTYSAQATLTLVCLAVSMYLSDWPAWTFLLPWAATVTALLVSYFAVGIAGTEAPVRALGGILLIPLFLPWRVTIELLGLLGYGRRHWVRTSRLSPRAILIAVLSALGTAATPADAQILFDDDFEGAIVNADGTIGAWDGPPDPSSMYVTDRVARSGRQSVALEYVPGTHGASFMYRLFLGQDRLYVRWYQRWSPGFVWEPAATKMVILRPIGGYPQFYPEVLWANGQLAIQAQVIAEANWDSKNFYQNVGEPITFQSDRWYCIEVFVKLNTPGSADGELAAWIDGEQKLVHTGRTFRGSSPTDPAPSTARIEAVGLSGYYGGVTLVPQQQFSWQDDVAASLQPIGLRLVSDGFETTDAPASGWDGPSAPSTMYVSDAVSHWGRGSLELSYTPGSHGAGYSYNLFDPQDRTYFRWYQRWSAGFVWEPSSTSLTGIRPWYGYPHFYAFAAGSAGEFVLQAQVVADRGWGSENLFQNRGDPVSFAPDRWYCIEVMVQLNTPGVPDGAVTAWIDGEEKLSYDGRQFRGTSATDPAPSTARLGALLISGQYGGQATVPQQQFSWHDDYVAATERIGCSAPPPGTR